jgi:hypothetical protein
MRASNEMVDALTKHPPTAEERHDFGEFWKQASDVDKLEAACRLRHVTIDSNLIDTPEFIQVCAIIQELDEKYGTVTIPMK